MDMDEFAAANLELIEELDAIIHSGADPIVENFPAERLAEMDGELHEARDKLKARLADPEQ
jgi:hypothetical protein